MTAPFDQDEEPTATFVPTWDDDDAPGIAAEAEVADPAPPPAEDDETWATVAPVDGDAATTVEADVAARDETGSGTLRPLVPEPVSEARRARSGPAPAASSTAGWAWEKLRAASGLLVLVVVAGIGLAAVIGLLVFAIAFALRRAAG